MIDIKNIDFNPFSKIGDGALLGVAAGDKKNAMTVSWGGTGIMWNKPVFTVYVRPQRHTFALAKSATTATLSFFSSLKEEKFEGDVKKMLSYFGRTSGRDTDKCATLSHRVENGALIFDDADLTLVGRKIYESVIDPAGFIEKGLEKNYNGDYHTIWYYEIIEVIKK